VGVDRVVVAAPVLSAGDVPGVRELRDDAVRRALGDPYPGADVAQAKCRDRAMQISTWAWLVGKVQPGAVS
jgi:hypothetical protein